MEKRKIVFVGVDRNAKGGVASVLQEYKKLFPDATFVTTTVSGSKLSKLWALVKSYFVLTAISLFGVAPVFHIHGASYTSFKRKYLIYRLLKILGQETVYHIHGGEFHLFYENADRRLKRKIKKMIEGVDVVVCLSERWKTFYTTHFRPKRIEVVRNIVSQGITDAVPEKTESTPVFLFLGNITEGKGIWLLLEASKRLAQAGKSFKLFIGGKGEEERLIQTIEEYGLQDHVEYLGWISGAEKNAVFQRSSVFVLPSYNEGVPISILEAMSFDLPVIATEVGGIPDILEHEVNGLLIAPGNVDELKAAMQRTIDDPETIAALGKGSSKRIVLHYPETVKQQLLTIYSEVI